MYIYKHDALHTTYDPVQQVRDRHVLFRLVPGAGIVNVLDDILHVEHLGSDSYFAGGVLKLLVHHMGGAPDSNIKDLLIAIRADQQAILFLFLLDCFVSDFL